MNQTVPQAPLVSFQKTGCGQHIPPPYQIRASNPSPNPNPNIACWLEPMKS